MREARARLLCLLPALCLAAEAGAQVTSNTALPIHDGEILVRAQGRWLRASAGGRDLDVLAAPTVLVYGANADLALFAVVPWLRKELTMPMGGGSATREAAGLGDIRLFARQTAWQSDHPGETLRFAALGGVKAATGSTGERDALGVLPRPLQPGSGTWDPLAGGVFTWQTLDWQLDVSGTWRYAGSDDGFAFGDELRLDGSWKYRVLPAELGAGLPDFLYAGLEANLVWNGRNRVSGVEDPDSGGSVLYLAPAIQYVSRRFLVEAAIQLPVVQNRNGAGLETDSVLWFGVRVLF